MNSICFEGQCQCVEGFYVNNRSSCVPKISIGETCSFGVDRCTDVNSDCVGGRCSCRQSFTRHGNSCKSTDVAGRLFTDCLIGGACSVANAICLNNTCSCPNSHFAAFGKCIPKIRLNERCDANRDVCSDPNSMCYNGFCTCQSEYYEHQQGCVPLGTFGAACLFGSQCQTTNGRCVNGYCVCLAGYFYRNGVCLPKIAVDGECFVGDGCLDANADCTRTQRCQCVAGYVASFGRCVLLVSTGQACDVDSICSDFNAHCLNGICQCLRGFERTKDNLCHVQSSIGVVPGTLDGSCLAGNTCSAQQLTCTITGLCACAHEYYKVQGQCVPKINLTSSCSGNDQCLDRYAVCDQGQCVCPRSFTKQANACIFSANVTLVACSTVASCPYPHAACVDGYCSCSPDYWLLAGQCYDQFRIFSHFDCATDAACSPSSSCIGGFCVCPTGHYAKSDGCYAAVVLGASCSSGDVCGDHHAVCSSSSSSSGGICVCQPSYRAESGICVSSVSNVSLIPCRNVSNCPYRHAICTGGSCGCEAGFKYLAGQCYVGIGGACSAGELCSDENAVCSDSGVCSCKADYGNESDKCVLASTVGVGSVLFGVDSALGIFLLILAILAALLLLLLLLCCLVYCCRRCRKMQKDNYERKLMETESTASESNTLSKVTRQGQLNAGYQATTSSSVDKTSASAATTRSAQHQRHLHSQQQQQQQRVINGSRSTEIEQATEMYSIEDLPRVTQLNREEIRSVDSALLSANEELDTDTDSSYRYRLVNRAGGPSYVHAHHHQDHTDGRYASSSSRRQMESATSYSASAEDARVGERRLVTMSSTAGTSVSTPSTIHRNVSAFGEITVMPVGDEDEHLRISVGEEII